MGGERGAGPARRSPGALPRDPRPHGGRAGAGAGGGAGWRRLGRGDDFRGVPRAPRARPPGQERLLRGAGRALQPGGRGAAGAGGQARVPGAVVLARGPDGARRGHRGRAAAGGEGGVGAGVRAPHAAGAGGAGPGLDPLRLPGTGHRWGPEDPRGGRRRVPPSHLVARGPPRAAAALAGHPARAGPGRPLPPEPPAPPDAAAGVALLPALPAAPAALRQRRRRPVGAAGHRWHPTLARGGLWHVPLRAARGAAPAPAAAAAGPPGLGPAARSSGAAGAAAPSWGARGGRWHLLQRGAEHPPGEPAGRAPRAPRPRAALVARAGGGAAGPHPAEAPCRGARAELEPEKAGFGNGGLSGTRSPGSCWPWRRGKPRDVLPVDGGCCGGGSGSGGAESRNRINPAAAAAAASMGLAVVGGGGNGEWGFGGVWEGAQEVELSHSFIRAESHHPGEGLCGVWGGQSPARPHTRHTHTCVTHVTLPLPQRQGRGQSSPCS